MRHKIEFTLHVFSALALMLSIFIFSLMREKPKAEGIGKEKAATIQTIRYVA